jgi:hypothetical protein
VLAQRRSGSWQWEATFAFSKGRTSSRRGGDWCWIMTTKMPSSFSSNHIREGGAKITRSHAHNERILVAMDASTYNVRKATCGSFCQTCMAGPGLLPRRAHSLWQLADKPSFRFMKRGIQDRSTTTSHVQFIDNEHGMVTVGINGGGALGLRLEFGIICRICSQRIGKGCKFGGMSA